MPCIAMTIIRQRIAPATYWRRMLPISPLRRHFRRMAKAAGPAHHSQASLRARVSCFGIADFGFRGTRARQMQDARRQRAAPDA